MVDHMSEGSGGVEKLQASWTGGWSKRVVPSPGDEVSRGFTSGSPEFAFPGSFGP